MKFLQGFVALCLLAGSGAVYSEGFEISGNIALSTDYIWRGKSQTQNKPAVSGGFDVGYEFLQNTSAYLGVWASNVDFDDSGFESDTSVEVDLYGGFSGLIDVGTGLGWDIGWLRYEYPGETSLNFNEVYAGLSYAPIEAISLSAMYYYGVKIEHRDPGNYTDLGADIGVFSWLDETSPLAFLKDVNLGLHAGYYDKQNANHSDEYWDWKFAISKDLWGVNWEFAYTDSDINVDSQDDAHLLFTLSKSL